jgi:thioredoxin reductase (NADPH)
MDVECLIIGGGPAGLTAGTYLGRFRRRTLLIDAGQSRAAWIPITHNLPGFTEGISGPDLLNRMHAQSDLYGAKRLTGTVERLTRSKTGTFLATVGRTEIKAQRVLLATGGLDVEPEISGIRAAVRDGLIRYCPICDAFEAAGRKVALVAYGKCRVREALLLRGYTANLTVLTLGREMHITRTESQLLADAGVRIVTDPISRFSRHGDDVAAWPTDTEAPVLFDVLYSALGTRIRSQLAIDLGASCDEDGALAVDRHQRTTVPGLFAAGDVVQGLSQVSIASAHAAIAATTMNAELPPLLFPGGTQAPLTI